MSVYEVKDATGKVYRISDPDPINACQRIADLHQVIVVAWRMGRWALNVTHPSQIEG